MFALTPHASLAVLAASAAFIPLASSAADSTSSSQGPGPYCAVQVFTITERQKAAEPTCFATEEEVSGYLEEVTTASPSSTARGASASVIVGTVYKDHGGNGASLTFWGTSGCAGATFGFPSLASEWANSISSVRAANGCWATVYTGSNYSGARLNCTPYCAALNGWNDNVKSLVFRPSGTFG